MAGECRLSLAYAEEQARFDLEDIVTRATQDSGDFIITGHKSMVQHGGSADYLVVIHVPQVASKTACITVFLVDAKSEGISIQSFPTVDGQQASEITFKDVRVSADHILGGLDGGFGLLQDIAIDGILALAAEAVGAMEVLYKDTVAYTQERQQFDQSLSDFQVLQHRMVDMFMEYEQCKSMLYRIPGSRAEGREAMHRPRSKVHGWQERHVYRRERCAATWRYGRHRELRIGHYFKRLLVTDAQFGNSDHHLAVLPADTSVEKDVNMFKDPLWHSYCSAAYYLGSPDGRTTRG